MRTIWKTVTAVCMIIATFAADNFLLTCSSPAAQSEGNRLTVAEFERLYDKLTKMSNEKVWSIPWQLSVRKARELAAKEKKPVFLWISSNGGTHPLGPC